MSISKEFSNGSLIEGWLRDTGCQPVIRQLPEVNWAYEVNFPPQGPAKLTIFNPAKLPRAVIILSRTIVPATHIKAFDALDEDSRREFLERLRATLNREFIEFHLEMPPTGGCPAGFQMSVTRFDHGVTLDSFVRSLSSVNKAYLDASACFQQYLGDPGTPAGGEFEFEKLRVQ